MMGELESLWGPIKASEWLDTPCVTRRTATEDDVIAGRAVFHIQGDSIPVDMPLPCCALQRHDDGSTQAVVVIQAEKTSKGTILGVRPLTGGNGVCTLEEVELLPDGFDNETRQIGGSRPDPSE